MTQHEEILKLLKQAGSQGINSFTYRQQWIQLPVRIKELKEMGHLITTRTHKDKSVDYVLIEEKKAPKQTRLVWKFTKDGRAYQVPEGTEIENEDPKVQQLTI